MHGQQLIIPVLDDDATNSRAEIDIFGENDDDTTVSPFCCSRREATALIHHHLPWSLNLAVQQTRHSSPAVEALEILDTVTEEGEEDTTKEDGDAGLVVAWQYRTDIQTQRLGISAAECSNNTNKPRNFCHSFDLQRRLADQLENVEENVTYVPITPRYDATNNRRTTEQQRQSGFHLFRQLQQAIDTAHAQHPTSVLRLLLLHIHAPVLTVALPLLLNFIRRTGRPIVLLLSHATASWQLQRHADAVLQWESFMGRRHNYAPPEFARDYQGLLHVRKASPWTGVGHFADATVHKRPAAPVYGVQLGRRKLQLSLLHIPPEDFAAGGGSATGGVRTGAGQLGCATAIDF